MLGATGSVGQTTLAVARRHPDRFKVVALAAARSVEKLKSLAAEFDVERVAVADPVALASQSALESRSAPTRAGSRSAPTPAGWRAGPGAVEELARLPEAEIVVNAVVGAAGLRATLASLEAGKRCALANKESLVAGGDLVLAAARRGGGELVPVDSEHSAIHQCLAGAGRKELHRVILTASGGPFRDAPLESLAAAGPEKALRHPTWQMGAKITIDSATLANKALEVIEAHFLFGLPYDRIEVVIHPTSVVHSFVEFVDGSVLAQLGEPTMELPVLHALVWPDRAADPQLRTFDPLGSSPLEFEPVDRRRFPLFELGVSAGRAGGAAPAVFNAANEVAVQAFLRRQVTFTGMAGVVSAALEALDGRTAHDLESVMEVDASARRVAAAEVEAGSGRAVWSRVPEASRVPKAGSVPGVQQEERR